MRRALWICFGAAAQLLFLATLPPLFLLLYRGGGDLLGIEPAGWAVADLDWPAAAALDVLLLGQFGLWHSLFLLPAVRRRLTAWVPSELYGSLFAVITCLSLLATALLWQPLPGVVYATEGVAAWLLLAVFFASWLLLGRAIWLNGPGFQTGLTPWWCYLRRQAVPPRRLVTTGLYRLLRHPIYLGVLGLIWFTPRMTTDRLLLACVWTGYVYLGSVLKDRRLLHFLGERYADYMARVPGYPLVPWGPLARRRAVERQFQETAGPSCPARSASARAR